MSQFKPDGIYRILCNQKWARNSPGQPYIVLDHRKAPIPSWEQWRIEDVPQGHTIQHVGSGLYAYVEGPNQEVRLGGEPTIWYIQPAGGQNHHISFPDQDSIWTSTLNSDPREFLFKLEGSTGSPNQQIQLVKVGDL